MFIVLHRVIGFDEERQTAVSVPWAVRLERIESFESGSVYLLSSPSEEGEEIAVSETFEEIRDLVERGEMVCG